MYYIVILLLVTFSCCQPAFADCITANAPVRLCVAPAANALSYEWSVVGYETPGQQRFEQTYTSLGPRVTLDPAPPNSALPMTIRATAVGADGTRNTGLPATMYIYPSGGTDLDGNGSTNSWDFTTWGKAYFAGCVSCTTMRPGCGCL